MAVGKTAREGLREVRVEALGDDFALVSGQWLTGRRIAGALALAERVWAFSAADMDALAADIGMLSQETGGLIVGIEPGKQPGWTAEDREAVAGLAGGPSEGIVGFLLQTEMPACGLQCMDHPDPHGTNKTR